MLEHGGVVSQERKSQRVAAALVILFALICTPVGDNVIAYLIFLGLGIAWVILWMRFLSAVICRRLSALDSDDRDRFLFSAVYLLGAPVVVVLIFLAVRAR